jgi:hypothetical protein
MSMIVYCTKSHLVHVQRFMDYLHNALCCKSFRLLDEGSIQEGRYYSQIFTTAVELGSQLTKNAETVAQHIVVH